MAPLHTPTRRRSFRPLKGNTTAKAATVLACILALVACDDAKPDPAAKAAATDKAPAKEEPKPVAKPKPKPKKRVPLTEYPPNRLRDGHAVASIPSSCSEPIAVLGSSKSLEFNFLRSVLLSHPEYRLVDKGSEKEQGDVSIEMIKFMGGYTPVARCADSKTCEYLARAYQAIVRTGRPRTACGDAKTPGKALSFDVMRLAGWSWFLEKFDYRSSCARIGACMIKANPKLPGDPALSCQAGPSKYKIECGKKRTCEAVMSCMGG